MSDDGALDDPMAEGDERERRLAALRGLAQREPASATSAPAPTPTSAISGLAAGATSGGGGATRRPRRARRPYWRRARAWALVVSALAVLIIGAVVAQVLGGVVGRPQTKRTPTPAVAVPALDQLHCESAVAWAPDSRRVALLGYQQTCPQFDPQQYNYFPGYVGIYDTLTGKSLAQINVDKPIQQALHLTAPVNVTPGNFMPQGTTDAQGIQYGQMAWSPDGKRLAMKFFVNDLSSATRRNLYGILLIGPDGSSPRVLAQPLEPFSAAQINPQELVWDLTTGTILPAPSATPPAAESGAGPGAAYSAGLGGQAQGWTWAGNGALVPQNPLLPLGDHEPPAPLAPIGDPIGGANFSIWQPGQINYLYPTNATDQPDFSVPGVPIFQNSFIAWSPDGRYLIDASQSSVLITPAAMQGPSEQTLEKFQLDGALGLPVRDAAMRTAMEGSAHSPAQRLPSTGTIAWSPDGKLLAMVTTTSAPQGDQDYATTTILILSCATGKTLATLKAHAAVNQTGVGGNEYMAWSPDGTRLFYFTDALGSLTTWGPGLLPRG